MSNCYSLFYVFVCSEAVALKCSVKKLFWKITINSQGQISDEDLVILLKKVSITGDLNFLNFYGAAIL